MKLTYNDMRINEKYNLLKKILTKDIVKHHLMILKESGAFGRLPLNKQLNNAIGIHLPILVFLDMIHRNPVEMDAIGKSSKTLCARVSMEIVHNLMKDFNYAWPEDD